MKDYAFLVLKSIDSILIIIDIQEILNESILFKDNHTLIFGFGQPFLLNYFILLFSSTSFF